MITYLNNNIKIKRNQLIIIILKLLSTVIKKNANIKSQLINYYSCIGTSSNWYEFAVVQVGSGTSWRWDEFANFGTSWQWYELTSYTVYTCITLCIIAIIICILYQALYILFYFFVNHFCIEGHRGD